MLEFEKKVMLTEREYCFLRDNRYQSGTDTLQVNHYYDTDDFELSKKGITCRIREKDGIYTATVKAHQYKGADCSVENSRHVVDQYDDFLFKGMNAAYQGCLETVRCTFVTENGISVMLDENHYLGIVDYELEIEYKADAEDSALNELDAIESDLVHSGLLTDVNVFRLRIGQGKNKSARFFNRKVEIMLKKGSDNSEVYSA